MSSFNLDSVSKALDITNSKDNTLNGVTFENKNLKLDTVIDAQTLVDAINKCSCLEFLNLAGNTLGVDASEAIAKALENHPEFKRALWKDLFTGRLKDEIPKSLKFLGAGLVKANARLTELDLSDNAFGPIGVQGLAALLSSPSCYQLQELRLNNNGLGIGGGKLLASALLDCYNNSGKQFALKVFIAGRNRLENEGAKALAKVFKQIKTLEEIAMPQNGIYHPGITALSESFSCNQNLRILNLNDNTLGPKGSLALSGALKKLTKLEKLNLGDCLVKTQGAKSLAGALKNLLGIQEVILDCNEIKVEGGVEIGKVLSDKKKLKLLGLDANMFGSDGREQVEEALGQNKSAMQSLEEDESPDEDEEEDEEEETQEEEETYEQDSDTEDTSKNQQNGDQDKRITITEFLGCPTGDKLLGLGSSSVEQLLQEAQSEGTEDDIQPDVFLNTYLPVLMKVAALSNEQNPEVRRQSLICCEALFSRLFQWGKSPDRAALLDNALLVHLGLIKSEDKKYRPPWNVDACINAVSLVKNKDYFPSSTKDYLNIFIKNSPHKIK